MYPLFVSVAQQWYCTKTFSENIPYSSWKKLRPEV